MTEIISDAEHQKRWTEATCEAQGQGDVAFQNWFDQTDSIWRSIVRGYWDFAFHILTPKVCSYINNPEQKTALEIGYGGGRILNAACSFFKQAIGIDIHNSADVVEQFLVSQGKRNFKLIRTNGRTIDVENESVDFIYSFIVLQHLPSFGVFESYVQESYRCLKVVWRNSTSESGVLLPC